jgi:hypothetical protein
VHDGLVTARHCSSTSPETTLGPPRRADRSTNLRSMRAARTVGVTRPIGAVVARLVTDRHSSCRSAGLLARSGRAPGIKRREMAWPILMACHPDPATASVRTDSDRPEPRSRGGLLPASSTPPPAATTSVNAPTTAAGAGEIRARCRPTRVID